MAGSMRHLALCAGLALALALSAAAHAQQTAAPGADQAAPAKGPPAGYVAPAAEPGPDESNAVRARTQPGNNAPFWRGVRESGDQRGVTSLPGAEQGVLIQSFVQYPGSRYTTAGEAWRQVRNQWLIPYGGTLLLIVVGALALFYLRKGALGGHAPDTGRLVERFTAFERAAHWANAIAFVVLAVSGLVTAFGKFFLLPFIGSAFFGWLSYALKTLHNFAGPVFAVSLLIVIATFVRSNLPEKGDLDWLRHCGGMLAERELPSHRFNAGEKVVFWVGVFLLGLVAVGSGLVLDRLVPGLGETRGQMQVAHIVHATATLLMMAVFLGHIYLGTIGTKGAYRGMRTGQVDEAWAQEHHAWWYDDVKAGRIPAKRSGRSAASPDAATPQRT